VTEPEDGFYRRMLTLEVRLCLTVRQSLTSTPRSVTGFATPSLTLALDEDLTVNSVVMGQFQLPLPRQVAYTFSEKLFIG